mmetsp:Transcript_21451/g.48442  ORF Transcript_21451/g.48442 Transcript_21451/m.48442 type:complete len:264 (-) Transcript_21451:182-973(-)
MALPGALFRDPFSLGYAVPSARIKKPSRSWYSQAPFPAGSSGAKAASRRASASGPLSSKSGWRHRANMVSSARGSFNAATSSAALASASARACTAAMAALASPVCPRDLPPGSAAGVCASPKVCFKTCVPIDPSTWSLRSISRLAISLSMISWEWSRRLSFLISSFSLVISDLASLTCLFARFTWAVMRGMVSESIRSRRSCFFLAASSSSSSAPRRLHTIPLRIRTSEDPRTRPFAVNFSTSGMPFTPVPKSGAMDPARKLS